MTRRGFLAAIGAAGACASLGAQEEIPRDVIPGQHALKLAEGDRDGLYYVPKGYKIGVRAPLWVVLHGAGGTAQSTQYMFGLADEFGVILTEAAAPDAEHFFQRLRFALNAEAGDERLTLSAGAAELQSDDDSIRVFERADAALFKAKQSGRDQLALAENEHGPGDPRVEEESA